jgi:molybdate transport system substrate-binding protein
MTATIKVLSAGAVKRGVSRVVSEFERSTGNRASVEFATGPEVRRRLAAGERADVIVAPSGVMNDLARQGMILVDSRSFVGRSRMGIVVHAGAPLPDVSSTEAFKRLLLGASAVAYNQASSGLYAARLIEQLGLKKDLGSRTVVVDTGAAIMEYVAGHPPAAVGLAQISEIMVMIDRGCAVKLAGPLPDEIQNVTSYDVAVSAQSEAADAARALARALGSPQAKEVFAETGID